MTQISGTNERFLNSPPMILGEIMKIMEPELVFIDVIPAVDSKGQPVTYGKKGTASADAKKQTPRLTTPSSKFPEITITRMTKESALLNKEGLSIRIDEEALRLPAGADMIADSLETAGYWLAEYVNSNIYTILRAGGTDAGVTPGSVWSGTGATPMTDLRAIKNAMKREGYPYRATDMYVDMTNLQEVEEYLAQSDIEAYRNAANGADDSIVLPMEGKPTLHGLFSSVTHGDILALDRKHKGAASYYYWNDPKYSVPKVQYETAGPAGTPITKTVQNFGLSMFKYFENETHDTVIQIWLDYTVKVKDAYGILYDDGL